MYMHMQKIKVRGQMVQVSLYTIAKTDLIQHTITSEVITKSSVLYEKYVPVVLFFLFVFFAVFSLFFIVAPHSTVLHILHTW